MALPADLTQLALSLRYGSFRRHLTGHRGAGGRAGLDSILGILAVRHHLGAGWAADLQLPVGLVEYDPGTDAPKGRLSGFGDLELGGRFEFASLWGAGGYHPSLTLRVGARLPSGKHETVVVPGVPPNLLGVGTGTFALAVSLDFTQFVHRAVALQASGSVARPFFKSQEGVSFSTVFGYGVGLTVLPTKALVFTAKLALSHRGTSRRETVGELLNSGGVWLAFEPGVGYRLNPAVSLAAQGRIPFYAHVNGTQLSESFSLSGSVVLTFGALGDKHEDAHDKHRHHHDAHPHRPDAHRRFKPAVGAKETASAAADIADLAVGGAGFDLNTAWVPGKLTVIDFWAEWCAPCHEIDTLLKRLAGKHPQLAVRRVEVPDFDSPVAIQHLFDAGALPVLWVLDQKGQRIFQMIGVKASEVEARLVEALRLHVRSVSVGSPGPRAPTRPSP